MKYLFIFLPFFAMAQGGDSTLVRIDTAYVSKHSSCFSDYLNGNIKLENGTWYRFQPPAWKSCDQHIGKSESYQREKTDTSEVKLLVWDGCSLSEISATKYLFYNEMQVAKDTGGLAIYITETIKVDVIARYVSEHKWIKPSHVIKEL